MIVNTIIDKDKGIKWIDIEKPSKEGLEKLEKEFNLNHFDIEEILSYPEISKIEEYLNYLFVILRFPLFSSGNKIIRGEVDLFVGKNFLITIHRDRIDLISDLFEKYKKRKLEETLLMFYKIIRNIFLSYMPIIEYIADEMEEIEEEIFEGKEREILEDVLRIKRMIIDLRKLIEPRQYLIEVFSKLKPSFSEQSPKKYATKVIFQINKISRILESQKETIETLSVTNESLISYKTSEIVKTLTIFSVIMLPLTLIASIYGMNIRTTPLLRHPYNFWIILGLMVFTALGMLAYFKRKKWL